ncbi:hypothetical protein EYE40_06210 [Glaciihabitans arcticus]|uniref:Histone acetyltransferase Rv0428c-like SH3 domain-containing protein n=1 Tax=Glaciihabitans arcticus TaxID=2668039 RepID=A0A4Q9GR24_9MICO|nr:hypothetical protein [Glaciihabitans arcticus]TBN57025.1 hypothetical protein EYE40_06210 [Glaciihabitans arcticus]
MTQHADFLRNASDGTRVVIRHLLHNEEKSATDVLGYLSGSNETQVVVATAKGLVTVELADVIAAKEIPPPPAPRPR